VRLPGFATRNLRLKLLAAAVATVIWAGVVYASNPPDTRSVTIKVPQENGAVAPYVLVHSIPDLVIRVSGTREHLNAFVPADLVVSVNYKVITHVGVQQIPVSVINNDRDVILDNPPTSITADVDHLDSRTVPVTVVISQTPPQGYLVTSTAVNPSTVSVIGPQKQLAGVEARVTVDLRSNKTNFQQDEVVVLYDSTGTRLSNFGVTIAGIAGQHQQGTVQVSITVAASITSRASAVLPRVSGTVAEGHEVAGIRVSSPTVVLAGPQDLLNVLDSVPTETISLSGLTGTLNFTVKVTPPSGVTATPDTVIVTVVVIAAPPASPPPTPTPTPTSTPSPT
jgi:YbbR domain-containing protein